MTVPLDLWQLITLLLAFFGAVFAFGKALLAQFESRLGERFTAQETLRSEATARWDMRFDELQTASAQEAQNWHRVERDFLKFRAELPRDYVRREDHIRQETVINAKLDALNARFDLLLERNKKD